MHSFENWYPYVFWVAEHEFQLCVRRKSPENGKIGGKPQKCGPFFGFLQFSDTNIDLTEKIAQSFFKVH